MRRPQPTSTFTPSLTKSESKAEAISRVAMETIEREITQREAKTARLRAARLAKEAADRKADTALASGTRRKASLSR